MLDDSPESSFEREELRAEANEQVETVLETLPDGYLKDDDSSEVPIDLEETLHTYRRHRPGMVLYKGVAEAEMQNPPAQIPDIANRFARVFQENFDGRASTETTDKIPELSRQVRDLVEYVRHDDSVEQVPDTLLEIHEELSDINEIYSELNVTVGTDSFEDI